MAFPRFFLLILSVYYCLSTAVFADQWSNLSTDDLCLGLTYEKPTNSIENLSTLYIQHSKSSNALTLIIQNAAWSLRTRESTIQFKIDNKKNVSVPSILHENTVIIRGADFIKALQNPFISGKKVDLLDAKGKTISSFSLMGFASNSKEFYECTGTDFTYLKNNNSKIVAKQKQFAVNEEAAKGALVVGAILTFCTFSPMPALCFSNALGAKSKNLLSSTIKDGRSNCTSDSQCGYRSVCIRKRNKSYGEGICMELERGLSKRSYEAETCRATSECNSGYKCDRTYKVCVKR